MGDQGGEPAAARTEGEASGPPPPAAPPSAPAPPPPAPGVGWSTPELVDGFWQSEDERGRRRYLGPKGWGKPIWTARPLSPFERKLRWVIAILLGSYLVFGFVPVVATEGICGFLPCDPAQVNTAAFSFRETGPPSLVVPACLGYVTDLSIETDSRDGTGTVLWSVHRTSGEPLPEQVAIGTAPPGFRDEPRAPNTLPTTGSVQVVVTTPSRRFRSWVPVERAAPGQVRDGWSANPAGLEDFRRSACAQEASVRPQAPGIVVVGGLACAAIPFVTLWLVVHHSIEKRRPRRAPRSEPTPGPTHG